MSCAEDCGERERRFGLQDVVYDRIRLPAAGEKHQPHPVALFQLPRGPFIAPQEPLVVHHHPDRHVKALVVPLDIG